MNSSRMLVTKKKMQFIMPNAKLAFNIEQVLLGSAAKGELDVCPKYPNGPRLMYSGPEVKLVQLALAMSRSSTTLAMRAPTKQKSMKDTKMADSRVDRRRRRVARLQTSASTDVMKSTRM